MFRSTKIGIALSTVAVALTALSGAADRQLARTKVSIKGQTATTTAT